MEQYIELVKDILENGSKRANRTGVNSLTLFGRQIRIDLREQFPLVPVKNITFTTVVHELFWMLRGEKNTNYLQQHGITKWSDLADEDGNLGPFYGSLWRSWELNDGNTFDQINHVIEQIKSEPDSRRILVNTWNLGELENMKLPPCHFAFQFHITDKKLSCMVFMRSLDVFNAGPYNVASYALLTYMVANYCDLELGELIISSADTHIYETDSVDAKDLVKNFTDSSNRLTIKRKPATFAEYKFEDFELISNK